MSRKKARAACLQCVFESLFHSNGGDDALLDLIHSETDGKDTDYVELDTEDMDYVLSTLKGVREKTDEIDAVISSHLRGWTLERISRVSHAVLLLSCYELLYEKELPPGIIMSEAVLLAQRYDEDEEGRFVNGVLKSIMSDTASDGNQET